MSNDVNTESNTHIDVVMNEAQVVIQYVSNHYWDDAEQHLEIAKRNTTKEVEDQREQMLLLDIWDVLETIAHSLRLLFDNSERALLGELLRQIRQVRKLIVKFRSTLENAEDSRGMCPGCCGK